MNYSLMDEAMQALFEKYVPVGAANQQRLAQFCSGQILAGTSQIGKISPWLKRDAKQSNREQWLSRLLRAPFLKQDYVYYPWLKQALKGYKAKIWHLIIDRSHLGKAAGDIVTIALSFRKRAIPLAWQLIPYGGVPIQVYIELIKRIKSLIPEGVSVLFHGDAEFGAIAMLSFLRQEGWDYILGQRCHYQIQAFGSQQWTALADHRLPKRRGLYLENLLLTKEHQYPFAQVFAFHQKGRNGDLEQRFYATSLPITARLRRLGKRRWGIEPFFRDMKSSGWQIEQSQLQEKNSREALLVLLACNYLWLTCLGTWLCKRGQRHFVDYHDTRQFSLFRLAWDWLVYQFRQQAFIPELLTLYS